MASCCLGAWKAYYVKMASGKGGKEPAIGSTPHQGLADYLPTGRFISSARPAVRASDAAACNRFVLGAHPFRADRLARALAARTGSPSAWSWRLGVDRENGLPTTFRAPPSPYRERQYSRGPGFAVCAGSRFIDSVGMSICGTPAYTRMRSGTALA